MEIDKIYNEDCLDGMRKIEDNSIDLVVTSPPYDKLRKYNGIAEQWTFEKFKSIAHELYRIIAKDGVLVWVVSDSVTNGSESGTSFKQALHFMQEGFGLYDTMIWEKPSPQAPTEGRYYDVFEYMFVFCKGKKPKTINFICDHKNVSAGHVSVRETRSCAEDRKPTDRKRVVKEYSRRFNVWNISRDNSGTGHPAVFPFKLVHDHIISWSNEGDLVLDPFMGSGTTAVACMATNRNYIGFELNKEYYEKSLERINKEALKNVSN